jgi:hypothetical protein
MQSNFQGSADYLTVKREGVSGPPIAESESNWV